MEATNRLTVEAGSEWVWTRRSRLRRALGDTSTAAIAQSSPSGMPFPVRISSEPAVASSHAPGI
jgi:hypothetical protein